VWEIITDPKRIGEWSHETHDGDWIGRSNTAVPGARFSGSNRLGRLKWTRVNQVVEVHPAHHYSWRTVPSALYPDSTLWTITLEPHAEGTEIVQTFEVLRINPIINRLYYLVAPAHRQRQAALTADLADLPIAIHERSRDRGVHCLSFEWGEGENGSAAHRRLVGAPDEDRRQPTIITDRAEGCDSRFAHECVIVRCGQRDQPAQHVVVDDFVFATRPRGHFDHGRVAVVQECEQRDRRIVSSHFGRAPANGSGRIGEAGPQLVGPQRAESVQSAERGAAHRRRRVGEPRARGVRVSHVTGQGDDTSSVGRQRGQARAHFLSKSERVVTA